jgi:hypothetical protein
MKTQNQLASDVNNLFDTYDLHGILSALSERCLDESAIAQGEGRPSAGRAWQLTGEMLADLISDLPVSK